VLMLVLAETRLSFIVRYKREGNQRDACAVFDSSLFPSPSLPPIKHERSWKPSGPRGCGGLHP
jgi:hypothetical protein